MAQGEIEDKYYGDAVEVDCSHCISACCKRVDLNTHELHYCQYLAPDGASCSIYEDRPIACRLDPRWTPPSMIRDHCHACQLSVQQRIPITDAIKQ